MIRILIADDHPLFREGLRHILAGCPDFTVADEARNGQEVFEKVCNNEYDMVLLDIAMPGTPGLEVLRRLKIAEKPKLPVLVLSMHPEEQYAVRVKKAGASGYLTKGSASEELVRPIRRISGRGKYITSYIAERLAEDLEPTAEKPHTPGQWFVDGILLMELAWKGKLYEREFHLRAYAQLNTAPDTVAGGFGLSFDWYATEKIGFFARGTVKDNQPISENHPNQIESDWQLGAVFFGPIKSRPDDRLGVAFGIVKGPVDALIPGAPKNHEMIIEIYYTLALHGGKLQVSPDVQFVIDPGGGTFAGGDNLFLLGVRVHVRF